MMLDWLLPPRCAGCGQVGTRWCQQCIEKCVLVGEGVCSLCGKRSQVPGDTHRCARKNHLHQAYAWGKYQEPLSRAIKRLKYSRDIGLGDALAQHLLQLVHRNQLEADVVVPVPLARKRQQERGYNQAVLLARSLAFALGMEFRPKAVVRIRETASQVGLSLEQRQVNVAGAFRSAPASVAGKAVLLVDDVLTTGATLDATAEALGQAGAIRIDAVVVARA